MMTLLRSWIPTIMWIVIIAFVATIFLAWGMDFNGARQEEPVIAKVGQNKIYVTEFDREVNIERERARESQGGGDLQPYQYRMISRQVLEREIQKILLSEIFQKMKFTATAEEIYQDIKNNPPPEIVNHPYFQTDSVFDTTKYISFLNNPQEVQQLVGLEQYARDFRIPMLKVQSLLDAGIFPSRSEVGREYRERNEKAVVEYARVNVADYKVEPSEITEEMIKKYHSAHSDSFKREKMAELYFVRVPKAPTAFDEQNVVDELLDIKKRVEVGDATFAEEAKLMSDDEGSAQREGSLPPFKKGQMTPEFEKAAFSLKPGAISDPIKTPFGYHLVLVEKREVQGKDTLVTARHILRKITASNETIDSIEAVCEDLRTKAKEKGFVAAVKEFPALQADSTGLFKVDDYIKGLGYLYGAAGFAFREKAGAVSSENLSDDQAYYVLGLKRVTEKGVLPVAEVREEIVQKQIRQKQMEKAREQLEKAITGLDANASIATLQSKDSTISAGTSDTVTRKAFVPGFGPSSKAIATAFTLPQGQRSGIIELDDGYAVVRPLSVQKISEIPWGTPAVTEVENTLVNEEKQRVYGDWYLAYKRKAKIEDHLNEVYLN